MTDGNATYVVQLTPPGRAAIASVAIVGPQAAERVAGLFSPANGRAFTAMPLGRIVFGRWGAATSARSAAGELIQGEEVVACRRSETNIEVHCHGGTAAVAAIVSDLSAAGAQRIDWEEFAAWSEGEGAGASSDSPPIADPIRVAARLQLAQARTERTAAILLDQYHGALRREIMQIIEAIENGDVAPVGERLAALLDRSRVGLHLTRPWKIVLAGPANVGKSTLINAIVGYQRAITYPEPGTTRDVVTASTAIDGWPVELADTAGLRVTDDPIETTGVARAKQQLLGADLQLLVFDRSLPWTADAQELIGRWPDALLIHNKSDLLDDSANQLDDRPSGHRVSALKGRGIDALLTAIAGHLNVGSLSPGVAVPFTSDQVTAIERAQAHLPDNTDLAVSHLRSLISTAYLPDRT